MKKFISSITLLSSALILSGCYETEVGDKFGVVTKISSSGLLFRTNEGDLIRGGINDGSGAFGNVFHFSVERKEALNKLQKALDKNKSVRILYHRELFIAPWRGSTNIMIDDVIFMDNMKEIRR